MYEEDWQNSTDNESKAGAR